MKLSIAIGIAVVLLVSFFVVEPKSPKTARNIVHATHVAKEGQSQTLLASTTPKRAVASQGVEATQGHVSGGPISNPSG